MRGEMNGWTKQLLSKGEVLHELHGSWLGQLRMAPVKDTDELSFSSYSVYYSPSALKKHFCQQKKFGCECGLHRGVGPVEDPYGCVYIFVRHESATLHLA
jgi:hypothetical protein